MGRPLGPPAPPESNTERIVRAIHESGSVHDATMEELLELLRTMSRSIEAIHDKLADKLAELAKTGPPLDDTTDPGEA